MIVRSSMRATVTVVGLGGAFAVVGQMSASAQTLPRVRSSDPYIRAAMQRATDGSSMFRTLVSEISATDGIVFVEPGKCRHGVHSCLLHSATPAAGYRILHVVVDVNRDVARLAGSIGHELQHVLEVLANARLADSSAIYLFYAREAATARETFETQAAVMAGFKVEKEIVGSPGGSTANAASKSEPRQ
jgi:hypothetical protein